VKRASPCFANSRESWKEFRNARVQELQEIKRSVEQDFAEKNSVWLMAERIETAGVPFCPACLETSKIFMCSQISAVSSPGSALTCRVARPR
jgi:hypothetical protein